MTSISSHEVSGYTYSRGIKETTSIPGPTLESSTTAWMDKGGPESPIQGSEISEKRQSKEKHHDRETVKEDVLESTEKQGSETEKSLEGAPEPSDSSKAVPETSDCPQAAPEQSHVLETAPESSNGLNTEKKPSSDPVEEIKEEKEEGAKSGDAPMDWFEPLEDDDEAESLAGESEISESVTGSERAIKKTHRVQAPRRKRSHPDEGWEDCPALGEGWKRKEVVRRSGSSMGQKDVYYLSPHGDRVRSRVELCTVVGNDLPNFDYKSGRYFEGERPPTKYRQRVKKKPRERSSSESSWVERGEGAETPDSHHRSTPNYTPRNVSLKEFSPSLNSTQGTSSQGSRNEDHRREERIKLPLPSSSRSLPLPSINGEFGTEDKILSCAKCGISFTGTWYDKQRKKPCCPSCWAASKTKEHPMIRFRKWIPCGQCVGCHNTVNCGQCANCKHGLQSPETRRRICRKRKCICPIRKADVFQHKPSTSYTQSEQRHGETSTGRLGETEEGMVLKTWHKKRKRRSCGECKACLCRKDCGTCDFCIDKPKFGGSNKKRQKCRLRQCQRQAMRHLLPFQVGQSDHIPDSLGRPRPCYTYSRKNSLKKNKGPNFSADLSDNDDDDSNLPQDLQSRWDARKAKSSQDNSKEVIEIEDDDDDFPTISQIYSLANPLQENGTEVDDQLMKLLESLRSKVLPVLWYAIMVEGPQLQLIQCSKQSSMTDTMVLIDPGFFYQITVQRQPLLPTHPLYDSYPPRLTAADEVIDLLLGLEKYAVCQGMPPTQPILSKEPIILERASTCDFLVMKNAGMCANCKAQQEL
ncbi:methyl-CpG-binding domain protein 1b [Pholidichthys leucotaenia]